MQNRGLFHCITLTCYLMGILLTMAQFSPIDAQESSVAAKEDNSLLELPATNTPSVNASKRSPAEAPQAVIDAMNNLAVKENDSLLALPTTNTPSINAPEAAASALPPAPDSAIHPPAETSQDISDALSDVAEKEKGLPLPAATMPSSVDEGVTSALPNQPLLTEARTDQNTDTSTDKTVQIFPPKILTIPGPPSLELLEEPLRFSEGLSLMFPEKDMFSLVIPSLALFDKAGSQVEKSGNDQSVATDDLTGLLESLKVKGEAKEAAPPPLPNIYLGSIVYYSDTNWSIWLNGKKVTNAINSPTHPLHVQAINRSQVRLVWKPTSMIALNKILNERKNASPDHLVIDSAKGLVTVTLKPNQTFVPSLLAVLEGLVKQTESVTLSQPASASEGSVATPPASISRQPPNTKSRFKRQ